MDSLRAFLLLITILLLIKGCFLLFVPWTAQRAVSWWLSIPPGAARAAGVMLTAAGLVVLGVATVQLEDPVLAACVIAGTLLVVAGLLYVWPPALDIIGKPFLPGRSFVWARIAGAVLLLIVVLLAIILVGG
mgnify:CR=1 FL=1